MSFAFFVVCCVIVVVLMFGLGFYIGIASGLDIPI